MVNWYGIDGIAYHPDSTTGAFEVTYNGIRDDSGMYAEDMMLVDFHEDIDEGLIDADPDDNEAFVEYMRENSHNVKDYIVAARIAKNREPGGER